MNKPICACCARELGFFNSKETFGDGIVCTGCLESGFIQPGEMDPEASTFDVCRHIRARQGAFLSFRPNRVCGSVEIDDSLRAFRINGSYFHFRELVSFTLHDLPQEPPEQPVAPLTGSDDLLGGMRGGVGASSIGLALGRSLANRFSGCCDQLYFTLHLRDTFRETYTLRFITDQVSRNTRTYRSACETAHDCKTGLNHVLASNRREQDARS